MRNTENRRVVVTGYGLVSCLGNDATTVTQALREGRSGISRQLQYAELGLSCQLAGVPDLAGETQIPRKLRRYMADAAQYAWHATNKAIDQAKLSTLILSSPRTGVVAGSGVGSPFTHFQATNVLREQGISKVPPYCVPQIMGSTVSAAISTAFGTRGVSFSISSACATSSHCIGQAAEMIKSGKQDVVLAGGAEEVCWTSTAMFDAMGALSTHFNETPHKASRPYDRDRDGFVIAGGAGILVLEALDHAHARGAEVLAELVGYGACSDGADMVQPSAEGAARAMQLALDEAKANIDYINTHATSTPAGDMEEVRAMKQVFGTKLPPFSSTKGLSGHAIGAASAHEAIYCLLMMQDGFIAGSTNCHNPDPELNDLPLVRETRAAKLETVMSNSFGFGGTNACLVFRKFS